MWLPGGRRQLALPTAAAGSTEGICSAGLYHLHRHSPKETSLVSHSLAIFISLEMFCVAR